MRTYLEGFFKDFVYSEKDTRELLRAYDAIVADDVAREEWESVLSCYETNMQCDIPSLRERAEALAPRVRLHPYTLKLLLFLCMTRQALVYYRERGLSDDLWRDTMMDLRYKLEECREVWGICGTFVATWFDGFFLLDRFTLGRLQFELREFKHTYEKGGVTLMEHSPVINVHIPRTGTPLDPASCDAAFAQAAKFYEKAFEGAPVAFICHSWLLYPANEQLLSPSSNVYAFMKRFDVLESGDYGEDHPDLWRLFDRPYTGDVNRLPYDSSMRRAYVDHIRAGGKSGWGFGVYLYRK